MSVSFTYPVLKPGSRPLQFRDLSVCYRSWQWRNFCSVHSRCSLVRTIHRRLPAPVNGLCYFRAGVTPARLPRLQSGVRCFSGDERSRNDDGGNVELKGFVFRLPNPLAWFKDRWYTYRIQSLVDPLFNLREFQVGAKQVCLAVL